MKRALIAFFVLTGCAAAPVVPDTADARPAIPVEVVGHVVRACPVAQPQANVQVTLRAAGELDALDTTQTDSSGGFTFKVKTASQRPSLLIEARGKKTLAQRPFSEAGTLVAELQLPCEG